MRYGFVSDVHGNLEALQACLAHLDAQHLDALVFLGDAVGYGANPNEVCDLLRQRVDFAVLGNHDAAVAGRMDFSYYYQQARDALRWCQLCISPENLSWLQELPYTQRPTSDASIGFCHGSPLRPEAFDYLIEDTQVEALLPHLADLAEQTFIGHSHLALSFRLDPASLGPGVQALRSEQIDCRAPGKHIITVGSVGQPRDRDPRACCGVFDGLTGLFDYHRLDYDVAQTRQKILDAGLPAMFGDRLLLGV